MILIIAIAAVAVIGLLAIGLGTVGIQNKKKKKVLAKRALEEAKANKAQEQSPIIINNNIPENAQQSAPVAAKAQEETKKCGFCNRPMPAINKFCPNCGKEVDMFGNVIEKETEPVVVPAPVVAPIIEEKVKEETKKCKGCGNEMPAKNRFCPNCGKEVDMLGNVIEREEKKAEPAPVVVPVVEEKVKEETKKCSNCGFEMAVKYHYCPNCSKEVDINGKVVEKEVKAEEPVQEPKSFNAVSTPVYVDDDDMIETTGVVITSAPRKTFAESIGDLSKEKLGWYKEIYNYALSKEDTRESEAQYALSVLCGRMKLMQILFQRGKLVCRFMAGSSELKKYSQAEKTVKIKEKPVIVEIDSKESVDAAKELIDISHANIQLARNKTGSSKKDNKVADKAEPVQVVVATTAEKDGEAKTEKPAKKSKTKKKEEPVQAVVEEPVKEEPAPVVEPVKEEVKEEKPAKKVKAKKKEKVKEEPAPIVEEPAKEEPVKEEPAPVVEPVKEEPAPVEPAKEEPVQAVVEEPVKEEPAKEEPAPVVEPVKEEKAKTQAKKETKTTKKAPATKATAKKARPVGKWSIEIKSDDEYMAKLSASNGEVMLSSEIYSSEEGAISGIATIIKNVESGKFIPYKNKNGNYYYKLKTSNNKLLCVGEIYKTKEQCLKSIESVKRIAAEAVIAEDVVEDAKYIEYTPEKDVKYEVKGKAHGKWKVEKSEEGLFSAKLYASNGQLMLATEEVSTKATAKKAIESVKKYSADGNFIIDRDKFGRFYYKLRNAQKSVVCIGEAYDSKENCISALESVRKFAAIADYVEEEATATPAE